MGMVTLHQDGHVATILIDRPAKLNAMTPEMSDRMAEIARAINRMAEIRVVVLRGAGERAFCVGSDITTLDRYPDAWDYHNRVDEYARSVRSIRKPVIAAIHGYCLGGGLEMAIQADIRIAAENASFGAPEVTWGWIGGGGASQLVPRLIGFGQASKLLLTGERIDAAEALRLGLVEEVVPLEAIEARSSELAGKIAAKAPIATQAIKAAIRASLSVGVDVGLEYENELVAATFMTEDKAEGVRAFTEKRAPEFKGR